MARVSSILFFLVAVLTVGRAAGGGAPFAHGALMALAAFVVLEWRNMPLMHKAVGSTLGLIGALAASASGNFVDTMYGGLIHTLPFLLIFASIGWLQLPSSQSPALLAVREQVLHQTPGKRFIAVAVVAHFLGATFNLAGLSLVTPMIARCPDALLQKRLGRAMIWGFGAATCWSPFFVGPVVVIAAMPGMRWLDVGPAGFAIGLLLLAFCWAWDRILVRPAQGGAPMPLGALGDPAAGTMSMGVALPRAVFVLLTLFVCVLSLDEGFGWSIPVALAAAAPVYALCWSALIARSGAGDGPIEAARKVVTGYASLRGEAFLFAGANLLGAGISAWLPKAVIADAIHSLAAGPGTIVAILMAAVGLISALGVHPLVSVVLITSVVTPKMIGVPPEVLALALMVMWGQGTTVSPLSATTLYMSRVVGLPGWFISWGWSGAYVLASTAMLMVVISTLAASGVF